MSSFAVLLGIFALLLLIRTLYSRSHSRARLPPGPPRKPLIGNLLDMPKENASDGFIQLGKVSKQVRGLYFETS